MPNVRLTKPVRHNGEMLGPDDVIPGLTEKEAARLEKLGVGFVDADVLDDGESLADESGEGDEPDIISASGGDSPDPAGEQASLDASAIRKMSKAELVALAGERAIPPTGKESKAELIALIDKTPAGVAEPPDTESP